jgi:hypothetical protein
MFVLTIADSTPVLKICIWQNCFKHWVLGELWKVLIRIFFGCKEWVNAVCVVCRPKFLSPLLITFSYLERGVSYDSSISQATSREKLRDSIYSVEELRVGVISVGVMTVEVLSVEVMILSHKTILRDTTLQVTECN